MKPHDFCILGFSPQKIKVKLDKVAKFIKNENPVCAYVCKCVHVYVCVFIPTKVRTRVSDPLELVVVYWATWVRNQTLVLRKNRSVLTATPSPQLCSVKSEFKFIVKTCLI